MTDTALPDDERLPAILEHMSDAFVELDDTWHITALNSTAADILRRPKRDLVGESLWDVLPPGTVGSFSANLHEVSDANTTRTFDASPDTDARVFSVRAYPTDAGVAIYFEDASTMLRARETTEQLQLLNRIMRHDIRNDMNVVLGWTTELEAHVDDEGASILDRIERTGEHVVDLTMILRDFVQALATDGTPSLGPTDLRAVIEEELVTRRATYDRATFTVDGEIPPVRVQANDLLSSVFRNILNNAVQHNDTPEPEITLSAETDAETVTVRIADNGPGLPLERADTLFGRTGEGLDTPGAGIGLYLVDTLVDQFDGEVWYEPNDPRGTVFVVKLPLAESETPAAVSDREGQATDSDQEATDE